MRAVVPHGMKRSLAGLLAVLLLCGVFAGCKIEMPDDVAESVLAAASQGAETDSSALEELTSEGTSAGETPSDTTASQEDGGTSSSAAAQAEAPSVEQQSTAASLTVPSQTHAPSNPDPGTAPSDTAASVSSRETAASSHPAPVDQESQVVDEKTKYTCTLSIRCDTILDNMDRFNQNKLSVLPKDGVIYAERTVTFYEGETVYDVLVREAKRKRIQTDIINYSVYSSAYVRSINNLYEFDCGEGSGWMYRINGWFPNYGCSRYRLKQGDKIEWLYTCELGRDIGREEDGAWQS